jgi:threonine dehydrogenase-like Zn-dependent dehydrogenase
MADWADDVLAYVLTIAGILLSNGLSMLKTNDVIVLDMSPMRLVLASIVALMVVIRQESMPNEPQSKAQAREGRRKHFGVRMGNAIAQGFMWSQLMNLGA